jgi:hypothetical protein
MKKEATMSDLIITPKTKIYDLLEAYPQLEDKLIEAAPQFKKLKNPRLRKTIARVTTLRQASLIAGLNAEDLVKTLRKEVGQDTLAGFEGEEGGYNKEKPQWHDEKAIARTVDAGEMLNAGEQPVHEVLSEVKKLKKDEILQVDAPFVPVPLLDKATSLGYKHWVDESNENRVFVYFTR